MLRQQSVRRSITKNASHRIYTRKQNQQCYSSPHCYRMSQDVTKQPLQGLLTDMNEFVLQPWVVGPIGVAPCGATCALNKAQLHNLAIWLTWASEQCCAHHSILICSVTAILLCGLGIELSALVVPIVVWLLVCKCPNLVVKQCLQQCLGCLVTGQVNCLVQPTLPQSVVLLSALVCSITAKVLHGLGIIESSALVVPIVWWIILCANTQFQQSHLVSFAPKGFRVVGCTHWHNGQHGYNEIVGCHSLANHMFESFQVAITIRLSQSTIMIGALLVPHWQQDYPRDLGWLDTHDHMMQCFFHQVHGKDSQGLDCALDGKWDQVSSTGRRRDPD